MNNLLGSFTRTGAEISVRVESWYDTDALDLWGALTSPKRLMRWFALVEGDLRAGGRYYVTFDASAPDERVTGVILTCRPPQTLVLTWAAPGEQESAVSVEISPSGAGSLLALTHKRLPLDGASGYGAGWQTFLEQLAAELSGREARGSVWDQRWEQLKDLYMAQLSSAKASTCRPRDLDR